MKNEVCPYANKRVVECIDCSKTYDDFAECEMLSNHFIDSGMVKQCPNCSKGILNPTFNKTLACDKCSYEEPIKDELLETKDLIGHVNAGHKIIKQGDKAVIGQENQTDSTLHGTIISILTVSQVSIGEDTAWT
jgi:ribosomal protein S27AE